MIKEGDKLKIKENFSGHPFEIGTEVTILKVTSDLIMASENGKEFSFVEENELESSKND